MSSRITKLPEQFLEDTKGGVAIITGLALPVVLGFAALGLEYSSALVVKSENKRTSDISAYAAAYVYEEKTSGTTDAKVVAAIAAAQSTAFLNGVSSDVSVSFDNPADPTYVEVTISEDWLVFLPRFISPIKELTINTTSRVSLGTGFTPCVLSLGDFKHDGFTVHGNAGSYNLAGCGVGANAVIEATGVFLDTKCAAPSFNKSDACSDQFIEGGFTDPFADLTSWPTDATDDTICDFTGSLLDDLSTQVGGDQNDGEYQLKEGVLCVSAFSTKFSSLFSDPNGSGNTLIIKAGVDFNMSGGAQSFSVKPSTDGEFAGVGLYAPKSDIVTSGNASFSIDGFSCLGIVVNSMTFNGNVTLNAECDEDDVNYGAGGNISRPRLIQ